MSVYSTTKQTHMVLIKKPVYNNQTAKLISYGIPCNLTSKPQK